MKLLKSDPIFEEKIMDWVDLDADPKFIKLLNKVEGNYEAWGRADAKREQEPVSDKAFEFCGDLSFPENAELAGFMAEHVKRCYMDGYAAGRTTV